MRTLITWIVAVSLSLVSQTGSAEDLLLEDYEGNGPFSVANWGNTETDSEGNANVAQDVGSMPRSVGQPSGADFRQPSPSKTHWTCPSSRPIRSM